jgi:O-acetyl-ADP-ribose deacetylase (regulator of RNase III)
MTTITYLAGDATRPIRTPAIIAHICNNAGGWGAGFSGALSRRWNGAEQVYRHSFRFGNQRLGSIQKAWVTKSILVVNMIAQNGYSKPGKPAIDYPALAVCLSDLAAVAKLYNMPVHMPRIGTGLAGGDWAVIEARIQAELCEKGVEVVVYDLEK